MEEPNSVDHLNSSLTDLMTSLMVIFILLLLVFVHRTAGKDAAVTDVLLRRLLHDMTPQGFNEKTIRPDPRDRNAILVIVPDRLMNFETGKSTLRPEGEQFLKRYIPEFADILCSDQFRSSIESIVVEGHTDTHPYVGVQRRRERKPEFEAEPGQINGGGKECSSRSVRHGDEARVLPRKAFGKRSWGAGAGGHARRKQAGDSKDPSEGRRSGIDEGGGPLNFTLGALRQLAAENQVIRHRAALPAVDAHQACQQLSRALKKLRQKLSVVAFDKPKLDVERVWSAFEAARYDLGAMDGLQFRALCSAEKTALRPEFISALTRNPEKLKRSRCLYGVVNSYFSEWREMKNPATVEGLLTTVFASYNGKNPVVRKWQQAGSYSRKSPPRC